MVLRVVFKSLIHFEFILWHGVSWGSSFVLILHSIWGGKRRFTVVSIKTSFFLVSLFIILLFSIQTTVNVLLPTLYLIQNTDDLLTLRPYWKSLLLSLSEKWGMTTDLFIRITGLWGSKQNMAGPDSSRQIHKTVRASGGWRQIWLSEEGVDSQCCRGRAPRISQNVCDRSSCVN